MDWTLKTRITGGLFFVSMILLLSDCTDRNNLDQWGDASIDSNLSKDLIYKQLDKQKEIFSAPEEPDTLAKKTSDVSYFTGKKIDQSDTPYSKFNNCRAHFYHSDTLSINIGIGNGFSGYGFTINYKDKKFYTQAYVFTDVIIEGAVEPVHKIIYQKLTLDKSKYMVGDSLFGKIEFKSIETDDEGNTTEHFGKGNFRTKISKF